MKLALSRSRTVSIDIAAEPALVWDVLSDYAAWPEWLPLVSKSEVTAKEYNFASARLELAPFPGKMVSVECIHTHDTRVLVKALDGQEPEFMLDWSIEAGEGGQSKVSLTTSWTQTAGNFMATRNVNSETWLTALKAHVGTFSTGVPSAPSDPDALIELYETESGLVCFYRGKKYEMKAVS